MFKFITVLIQLILLIASAFKKKPTSNQSLQVQKPVVRDFRTTERPLLNDPLTQKALIKQKAKIVNQLKPPIKTDTPIIAKPPSPARKKQEELVDRFNNNTTVKELEALEAQFKLEAEAKERNLPYNKEK